MNPIESPKQSKITSRTLPVSCPGLLGLASPGRPGSSGEAGTRAGSSPSPLIQVSNEDRVPGVRDRNSLENVAQGREIPHELPEKRLARSNDHPFLEGAEHMAAREWLTARAKRALVVPHRTAMTPDFVMLSFSLLSGYLIQAFDHGDIGFR